MRVMYDSIEPAAIPVTAPIVGGYIDGAWGPNWRANGQQYGWDAAAWARFPNSVKVRIAAFASTNDGHVLDVETGDATPDQAPAWVLLRRSNGVEPSLYCNLSNVDAVRAAFVKAGVPLPPIWLAHYDGNPAIPDGFVAKQYLDQDMIAGRPHYDLSSVLDFWPGVDAVLFTPPPLFAQSPSESSTDLNLKVKEVGEVVATWSYRQPDGTYKEKSVIRKVWSQVPGRFVYTIYPQVDPEADPTECLDGRPAIFLVNVTTPT